jgi:hypothetical protein
MAVVDAIAALKTVNAGGNFANLPVFSVPPSGQLGSANLVIMNPVAQLPTSTDSDRVFNYLEAAYSLFLSPPGTASANALGYYYRYYPGANAYIGTANGVVYYLVPAINNNINALGNLADWLAVAAQAGY